MTSIMMISSNRNKKIYGISTAGPIMYKCRVIPFGPTSQASATRAP